MLVGKRPQKIPTRSNVKDVEDSGMRENTGLSFHHHHYIPLCIMLE